MRLLRPSTQAGLEGLIVLAPEKFAPAKLKPPGDMRLWTDWGKDWMAAEFEAVEGVAGGATRATVSARIPPIRSDDRFAGDRFGAPLATEAGASPPEISLSAWAPPRTMAWSPIAYENE